MKTRQLAALALLFALVPLAAPPQLAQQQRTAPAAAAPPPPVAAATLDAAKRITAARLAEHLRVVASDEMGGRDTPSPGLDAAARYLADQLKRLGVRPAGDDGTYFQRIALRRDVVDPARTSFEVDGRPFRFGEDFLTGRTGGAADAGLVYVGHGWVVKSRGIDPYKGVDVRDKIMVVAGTGLPPGVARADVPGKPGADWDTPASYAQRNGARALVVIPRTRDFSRWWGRVELALQRGAYQVERLSDPEAAPAPTVPLVYPSRRLLEAIFAGERLSADAAFAQAQATAPLPDAPAAFALSPQKRVRLSVAAATETASTQNVVGVLEGRDPVLKHEYVALGAHYDHVGTGAPAGGDSIYNGADDDGSGTVAVLAMAEAFARGGGRPRRSILFVWHCAEEKGLWGSEYFTRFPTVPVDKIVAQLNMDMIGRSRAPGDTSHANRHLTGPEEVYVIGSKMMSTELGELSERVNRAYLNLSFNYKYDDPRDPERFFFRSDHYNYARRGIPIIFYFVGPHEDYHRPDDEVEKIDFRKMERIARTVFATAAALANAPSRPRVDKQLPAELSGQ